jgi:hypothetical protein
MDSKKDTYRERMQELITKGHHWYDHKKDVSDKDRQPTSATKEKDREEE